MQKISPHFFESELCCPCCSALIVDQLFIDSVESMRIVMDLPFIISRGGGFRCERYNQSLPGAAEDSQHKYGRAIDVFSKSWSGRDKRRFVQLAIEYNMSIGIYEAHFHIDQRKGEKVVWWGAYK